MADIRLVRPQTYHQVHSGNINDYSNIIEIHLTIHKVILQIDERDKIYQLILTNS